MTAIVTGTDSLRYVHEIAGEAPVFVAETARTTPQPQAAIAGHARLVAWLVPLEAGGARRARLRLPTGEIVEVTAKTVFSAANIARAWIVPAHRYPTAAPAAHRLKRPRPSDHAFPERVVASTCGGHTPSTAMP